MTPAPSTPAEDDPRLATKVRSAFRRHVGYRVTGGGLLYFAACLVVGFASFFTANNLLFLVFSAMLATLLVSGFLSRLMLSGLELELLLPEHVWARTAAPACIRLRNLKRLTPSFSLELSGQRGNLSDEAPILTAPVYFPIIPGRTTVEASVEVTFPQRGRHKENVFLIATRFPFGFLRKTTTIELQRETVVYPTPEPFPGAAEILARAAAGEAETAALGIGRDFYRVRPYVSGDNARHIDWKSSAHTGAPHVREFSREEQGEVEVLLDRRTDPGSSRRFEITVERCAFLVSHLASGYRKLSFSSQGFTNTAADEDEFYVILRYLALVEPLIAVTSSAGMESIRDVGCARIVFSSRADANSASGDSLDPEALRRNEWDGAYLVGPV